MEQVRHFGRHSLTFKPLKEQLQGLWRGLSCSVLLQKVREDSIWMTLCTSSFSSQLTHGLSSKRSHVMWPAHTWPGYESCPAKHISSRLEPKDWPALLTPRCAHASHSPGSKFQWHMFPNHSHLRYWQQRFHQLHPQMAVQWDSSWMGRRWVQMEAPRV